MSSLIKIKKINLKPSFFTYLTHSHLPLFNSSVHLVPSCPPSSIVIIKEKKKEKIEGLQITDITSSSLSHMSSRLFISAYHFPLVSSSPPSPKYHTNGFPCFHRFRSPISLKFLHLHLPHRNFSISIALTVPLSKSRPYHSTQPSLSALSLARSPSHRSLCRSHSVALSLIWPTKAAARTWPDPKSGLVFAVALSLSLALSLMCADRGRGSEKRHGWWCTGHPTQVGGKLQFFLVISICVG